jgi:putative Mg2+ transporter-C (MgtC) family protein
MSLSPGVEFLWNVATAFGLGTIIGFERQLRQHPAGLRTNALVCLGAAMFVSVTHLMNNEAEHPHVAAQIVSGIGFLAGGVILREGFTVHGMNTAATIWCTAAIGTLAGVGFRKEALLGTMLVLFLHMILRPVVDRIEEYVKIHGRMETHYRLQFTCASDQVVSVRKLAMEKINALPHMAVHGFALRETDPPGKAIVVVNISSRMRNDDVVNNLLNDIESDPRGFAMSWEEVH